MDNQDSTSRVSLKAKQPTAYDYLDYRLFLKDLFKYKKENNKHFSYRMFARKAGFASPNYLKLVMDGQRNLTNESIAKMAKGFGLKKKETEYFENLVFMNQASTHDMKNHYLQKIMAASKPLTSSNLEKASYEYFSRWYYPVIREVILFGDRKLSFAQIAAILSPRITEAQAKKGIELLLALGLIKIGKDGLYEQADKTVRTGAEVRSLVVANFHREMIRLAAESIERHPAEYRDISGITLSVKKEKMPEIKSKIVSLREELLELACQDEDADQVIQINIQAFPLTKTD